MAVGDFAGAWPSLQEAEASYVKAEKFSHTHEFTMIEVKDQAETKILGAAAVFQLGRRRFLAASSRIPDKMVSQQAQSLLSRFKSAQ